MSDSVRVTFICPTWLHDAVLEASKQKNINKSEYIKDILKALLTDGTLQKARENKSKSDAI